MNSTTRPSNQNRVPSDIAGYPCRHLELRRGTSTGPMACSRSSDRGHGYQRDRRYPGLGGTPPSPGSGSRGDRRDGSHDTRDHSVEWSVSGCRSIGRGLRPRGRSRWLRDVVAGFGIGLVSVSIPFLVRLAVGWFEVAAAFDPEDLGVSAIFRIDLATRSPLFGLGGVVEVTAWFSVLVLGALWPLYSRDTSSVRPPRPGMRVES